MEKLTFLFPPLLVWKPFDILRYKCCHLQKLFLLFCLDWIQKMLKERNEKKRKREQRRNFKWKGNKRRGRGVRNMSFSHILLSLTTNSKWKGMKKKDGNSEGTQCGKWRNQFKWLLYLLQLSQVKAWFWVQISFFYFFPQTLPPLCLLYLTGCLGIQFIICKIWSQTQRNNLCTF
jgi:hypothetical protein